MLFNEPQCPLRILTSAHIQSEHDLRPQVFVSFAVYLAVSGPDFQAGVSVTFSRKAPAEPIRNILISPRCLLGTVALRRVPGVRTNTIAVCFIATQTVGETIGFDP